MIVVHATWAELGHSHFLYVPAVSNVVTPMEMARALKLFYKEPCA